MPSSRPNILLVIDAFNTNNRRVIILSLPFGSLKWYAIFGHQETPPSNQMLLQSRDSSATYLHMHSSRHADLFEDFCRPPSSSNALVNPTPNGSNPTNNANGPSNSSNGPASTTGDPSTTHLPGHFLPFEEIHLPPHLMPLNPEDEDDVVPDMHAAFGITRALGQNGVGGGPDGAVGGSAGAGAQREPVWRDLGLERLVENGPVVGAGGVGAVVGTGAGVRREGKRAGRVAMIR